MKKLLFCLILFAGCAKEPTEVRMVQLLVEGKGSYLITYGTSDEVTVKGENTWSAALNVDPGENIFLAVKTDEAPATIYMRIEIQEGLLYCKNLYIEPQSSGSLIYID